MSKNNSETSNLPEVKKDEKGLTLILGNIKMSPEIRLDVMADFNSALEEIKAKNRREERAWLRDYYRAFGYDDDYYDDWYDDEYYDHYPQVKTDNKKTNKNPYIKPQRIINGIEVDPDIDDKEAFDILMHGNKKKGKKRFTKSEKRKNMGGGMSFRMFQDGWEDDDDDVVFSTGDDDLDDPRDEEKYIVFYRRLNNTADTYVFTSVYDFSEWLEEENIKITDRDAYDAIYKDEMHCCLDPQSSSKSLVCADDYEDLVYYVTGGDEDYLAEVSNMAPYI